VNKQLSDAGYITVADLPDEFAAHLKSEVARLGQLIQKLGLKAN
jgi:tripartite-type tricarboxylate transporter receptor subunit TctC